MASGCSSASGTALSYMRAQLYLAFSSDCVQYMECLTDTKADWAHIRCVSLSLSKYMPGCSFCIDRFNVPAFVYIGASDLATHLLLATGCTLDFPGQSLRRRD